MFRTIADYLILFFTKRTLLITLAVIVLINLAIMWWVSRAPDVFSVAHQAQQHAKAQDIPLDQNGELVTGYVTTASLIHVGEVLLSKEGGYLSNDVAPPFIFLDNMPSWEFGVLVQMRDLARALRNDFSRSQTQSQENVDLALAEPKFNVDNTAWAFPSAENEYREGLEALDRYLLSLADVQQQDAQFYARADNLNDWLAQVEKRLGALSQRLSASVGQVRVNTDLSGEAQATQSTQKPDQIQVKTPWLEIDNVFYEARGATWALLHFLRAMEIDLHDVLEDKNARVSVRQIIRELEAAQQPMGSPMILNGSPFGAFANHSLVMANYIARANAAIIDLRRLLADG